MMSEHDLVKESRYEDTQGEIIFNRYQFAIHIEKSSCLVAINIPFSSGSTITAQITDTDLLSYWGTNSTIMAKKRSGNAVDFPISNV